MFSKAGCKSQQRTRTSFCNRGTYQEIQFFFDVLVVTIGDGAAAAKVKTTNEALEGTIVHHLSPPALRFSDTYSHSPLLATVVVIPVDSWNRAKPQERKLWLSDSQNASDFMSEA